MAIQKLPSKDIKVVLTKHLNNKEWEPTTLVIKDLAHIKSQGFLTKADLFKIARWKAPRATWRVNENTAAQIKKLTARALEEKDEAIRMSLLIQLKGVGVPMASAILMLTNPKKYGVIDIRVWQLLNHFNVVNQNKAGINFTINQWSEYLNIIRLYAKTFKVTPRDIDRTLFIIHKTYQKGNLK